MQGSLTARQHETASGSRALSLPFDTLGTGNAHLVASAILELCLRELSTNDDQLMTGLVF